MRVTVAKALGTCFGVQDAIDLALDPAYQSNLTIIGQLVHNPQTVERLRKNGVELLDSIDELDPANVKTRNVMITAHGAAGSIRTRAEAAGFRVIDASCPLVLRVHKAIAGYVRRGYHPVVIGQDTHVEVRGIVGDLEDYTVIGKPDEIDKLESQTQIGIVSQTTQQIDFVLAMIEKIKARYPAMKVTFTDTVCQPTKDRQIAVRELAAEVDLMIVIGGYNSSNTKKLSLVCKELGVKAHHIERAGELNEEWFANHEHVGITAGTSTPYEVINEVYQAILNMPGVDEEASSGLPDKPDYVP